MPHKMLWVIIMIEAIFLGLALVLNIFGVIWFIQQLALYICSPTLLNRAYIVFLEGENADIELQLAISNLSWSKAFRRTDAFAVDMGLSEELKEKCKLISKNTRFVFIDKENFRKIV